MKTQLRKVKTRRTAGKEAQSGTAFIETLVALALLGLVALAFLSGLTTTSRAEIISDEQSTAESLARSQMDFVKEADYAPEATSYSPAAIPSDTDYTGYSATVAALPLHSPDDGIQKITVTIQRSGNTILVLEGYKVDR